MLVINLVLKILSSARWTNRVRWFYFWFFRNLVVKCIGRFFYELFFSSLVPMKMGKSRSELRPRDYQLLCAHKASDPFNHFIKNDVRCLHHKFRLRKISTNNVAWFDELWVCDAWRRTPLLTTKKVEMMMIHLTDS